MMNKSVDKIIFAGAGPGAPDLITLRCIKAIEAADLIIYAGSLVNPEILIHAGKKCRILDSAKMSLDQIVREIRKAHSKGLKVLRLHTGDPAIYGAIAEQMSELDKYGIPYEVIPGVSSVFASAAALKTELTAPGVSQTVILTRQAGRTPVPHGQEIANLARHGATMAIFLSSGDVKGLAKELVRGGYSSSTPASVVYRASWKDEKITRGTLADISERLERQGFAGRQAMIIVGDVQDRSKCSKSLLYDKEFTHGYRKAVKERDKGAEGLGDGAFKGKVAIYAITAEGLETSRKLLSSIDDGILFAPERFKDKADEPARTEFFGEGDFDKTLSFNWKKFDGHIFVMATGIVVRKIAKLLDDKTRDPAVVVCDQRGNYAVSLLSGHIGGANRLANFAAETLGGQSVVTTATDVQKLMAFDELASIEGWKVVNPKMIKSLNSMLLEGKKIGLMIPGKIFNRHYAGKKNLRNVGSISRLECGDFDGCVVLNVNTLKFDIPSLILKSP